jgi:hypothetical protein
MSNGEEETQKLRKNAFMCFRCEWSFKIKFKVFFMFRFLPTNLIFNLSPFHENFLKLNLFLGERTNVE